MKKYVIFFCLITISVIALSQDKGKHTLKYNYWDLDFNTNSGNSEVVIEFDNKKITVYAPHDVLKYTFSSYELIEGKIYDIYKFYINNDKSVSHFTYNKTIDECNIEFITGNWIRMYNK